MNTREGEIPILHFSGQVSNKDPHDLDPGQAAVQVNCMSLRAGELVVRGGLREMVDDQE